MYDKELKIDLKELKFETEFDGFEVGFPTVAAVTLFSQERIDGIYNYYIDAQKNVLLDFWLEEKL